ncbi:hypothetical protein [Pedobacter frigoris]|uniref:hypothetical protein n=1 Tax=Pedobacter frigoris TaxID=2571272 RepID=UPI002931EBBF|nr:hypothetical protein [Pedobacter frigoris]
MALAIKSIPVLQAKVATKFVRNASANSSKKGSVDFSAQVEQASKILDKAKLK